MLRFYRSYSNRRSTHLISDSLKPIEFTDADRRAMDSVLKLMKIKSNRDSEKPAYRTKERKEYIASKLAAIKSIFPLENKEFISADPPAHIRNLYFDVYAKDKIDSRGNIVLAGTTRLSVTKLLTKRWCELSEMYDICSRIPIFEHKQLKIGKMAHEQLEGTVHAIDVSVKDFMDTYEWELADDELHRLAEDWFQCINRLVTLFVKGEAREIICHGYLDSRTGNLVEQGVKDRSDILVSGIIDHVILFDADPTDPVPLLPALRSETKNDLREMIATIKDTISSVQHLEIAVSDVKTRPRKTIPNYPSVINASKLQIMYYRNFIETLGSNPTLAYQKLLLNAERRGINIDDPINISNLIYFMEIDPSLTADFERIMLGEPIGFEPFDEFQYKEDGKSYDLSKYADLTVDESTIHKYGKFYQEWAKPPTLRYFAARMAQLYNLIKPLLSDHLMIEYYAGDVNFKTLYFNYDPNWLAAECKDSSMFWFGQRLPRPVPPTKKNIETFCKYCDFHDVCSWRAKGDETMRQLGKELQSLTFE